MQMDETYNTYTKYIPRAKVKFIITCEKLYQPSYKLDEILLRDLNIRADFVLGLDFMVQNNGGCFVTKDWVIFASNITHSPVQTQPKLTKYRSLKDKSDEESSNSSTQIKSKKITRI